MEEHFIERLTWPEVDAREPRGDLVDGPVEIVDPPLQGDREVDDVGGRAAEYGLLAAP